MKKTTAIIAIVLLLSGCGKWLDQYPHNAVSPDNLTDEDAELLLTGMYNIAQYKPTFNGYAMFDIIGGDIIRPGATSTNTPALVVQGAILPDGSMVSGPWNGYYAGMYQINSFLASIGKMEDSGRRTEMLGTGHFFRGLYYYYLVTRWRNVPIVKEITNDDIAASDEADVWGLIEEELKMAAEMSPVFSDKNYVSRQAAKALLARSYLAMGRKGEAAALAEELIADQNFSLAPFKDIFRGQPNKEEIFTFANLVTESSVNISSYYYTKESPVGGSYTFCPTQEAMEMYLYTDSRREISVDVQGSSNVVNKYCSGDAGHDPIYIARLAEMYLVSAEGKGFPEGLGRLNELRIFRGVAPVSPADEDEFINAILNERRLELFGEGFRYYDLVRTGKYESTVGVDTRYTVFPVPSRELTLNKKLRQHPLWTAPTDEANDNQQ